VQSVSSNGDGRGGFREDQMMAFREAYVWLATNLRLTLGQHPVKSILVTSALPGEGKTTIAINLAMSLAEEGQRVLLIDADLRAGRIAQSLGIRSGKGLTTVLAGKIDVERAVTAVDLGGGHTLNVLPGNGPVPRPTQMLSSRRYRDLLEWAKASYDAVIIDSTPVNNVADAAVLARNADGVLFVARSGVSEYPAISFAMEQLRASGATVLGAVLNDADLRRDAELGHAYEYYGRYAAATAST
jgi:polysaccharide biosynthesis transport protein